MRLLYFPVIEARGTVIAETEHQPELLTSL